MQASTQDTIVAEKISKSFGRFEVLKDVSVKIKSGELVALLGPSGSGKTTLLRIIAGLESPDQGSLFYQGQEITNRSVREREVGFVFQHYALFPHLDVFENIAFGLRIRKAPEEKVQSKVKELLHLIRLEGLGRRYPSQLSGGQRQRVALARALAVEPKLLLLDEPFGALDVKVRQELRQWLRKLHDEIGVTSVFVTHDQEEAFDVADRVILMDHGKVVQDGAPHVLFEDPASAFVADFIGKANVIRGSVLNGQAKLGGVTLPYPEYTQPEEQPVTAYIRTHELDIEREEKPNSIAATLERINLAGTTVKLRLKALREDTVFEAELPHQRLGSLSPRLGDLLYLSPQKVRVFLQNQQGGSHASR